MDWLGIALTVVGNLLVSRGNKTGFLLGALGCLFWIEWAIQERQPTVFLINLIFFLIAIYGLWNWSVRSKRV